MLVKKHKMRKKIVFEVIPRGIQIKSDEETKKHILIIDCYHDSDKGGQGIIDGTINTLNEVLSEKNIKVDISLMYRFSKSDSRFASASRHTSKRFPKYTIYGSPISTNICDGPLKVIRGISISLIAVFDLLFPSLSRNDSIKAIRKADLIISKGGNFYKSFSNNFLIDLFATLYQTYGLILSIRLNKPLIIMSHSFGPYKTRSSGWLMSRILDKSKYLSCREGISKKILISIGLDQNKINLTPDLAFGCKEFNRLNDRTKEIMLKYNLNSGQYAVITSRHWFFDKDDKSKSRKNYFEVMGKIADYLSSQYVEKVILVVHNDGMHSKREDDVRPIKAIYKEIVIKSNINIINEDLSFDILAYIYQQSKIIIGTRLHTCIFSLIGGTPAIAISYQHKVAGIMNMLGLDNYVLNIGKMNFSDAKQMIDKIMNNRSNLSKYTLREIESAKQELKKAMNKIIEDNLMKNIE